MTFFLCVEWASVFTGGELLINQSVSVFSSDLRARRISGVDWIVVVECQAGVGDVAWCFEWVSVFTGGELLICYCVQHRPADEPPYGCGSL